MNRFAFLLSLVALMIALPLVARSQRPDSRLTYVLELGGKRAVLAGDFQSQTSGTAPSTHQTTGTAVRQAYSAPLAIVSVRPFLGEFFSSERPSPQSGQALVVASDGTARAIQGFANASVTEVRFPAMDAASRSTGSVMVQLSADGARSSASVGRIEARTPIAWQSNAFRVRIGALPCERVNRVGTLTVQRPIVAPVGGTRTARTSSQTEVSHLVLTMGMRDIDPWQDWFREFAVDGNAGAELSGTLEYFDATLRNVLLTVELAGVGITRLEPLGSAVSGEEIRRFQAELYIRSVRVR